MIEVVDTCLGEVVPSKFISMLSLGLEDALKSVWIARINSTFFGVISSERKSSQRHDLSTVTNCGKIGQVVSIGEYV